MAKDRKPIEPRSLEEFRAAMKHFAEEMKGDIEMVEREQMRLMMRDAMTFSAPMPKGGGRGLSAAAHKAGMNKLGNDIRRIFIPQDAPVKAKSVYLRQVINAVKGNDRQTFYEMHTDVTDSKIKSLSPVMRKIMEDTNWQRAMGKAKNYLNKASINGRYRPVAGLTTNPRSIHDKYKNAVGGRWKRNQPVGGPQYFISTTDALNAYIAERQQRVGWIKAGYADALAKIPLPERKPGVFTNIGVYNAPWVDALKAGYGTFTVKKTSDSCAMVAGNNIGNINNVATDSDVKNVVYGNRYANIMSAVKQRLEKTSKDASKGKK